MKTKTVLGGLLFLALASCSSESPEISKPGVKPDSPKQDIPIEDCVEITLNANQLEAVNKSNDLTFNLFDDVLSKDADKGKICVSPLSILNLLSLSANGASTETLSNITGIFGLNGTPKEILETINSTCKEYYLKLPNVDPSSQFFMSNSFWCSGNLSISPKFEEILSNYYGGMVVNESPAGIEGQQRVNNWVNENTNGLIPNFLEQPIESETLLLNTVYFKGSWTFPFEPEDTRKDDFMNLDGTISKTDFMRAINMVQISEDNKFTMVTLPMGNESFSMSFVIQNEKGSRESLTKEIWSNLLNGRHSAERDIRIPKFDFSYDVSLAVYLEWLFPGCLVDTDFSQILNEGKRLSLSVILHKTKIRIDEEKCEGAGATGGYELTMPTPGEEITPRIIKFDRPLYFVVHEKTTGAILFLGYISAF